MAIKKDSPMAAIIGRIHDSSAGADGDPARDKEPDAGESPSEEVSYPLMKAAERLIESLSPSGGNSPKASSVAADMKEFVREAVSEIQSEGG